jgi:hypothetical protein
MIMSVNCNYYAFYGIRIDDFDFEEFAELYDDVTNVSEEAAGLALFDGMSGAYMILGHMLFDSGDVYDGGPEDVYCSINVDSFPVLEAAYRAKFNKYFPEFKHLIADKKFDLMVFAHYS